MRLLANGVMPHNNALLSVIGSYVELVTDLRITNVPSGIVRLYLMQTGGVARDVSRYDAEDIMQAYQADASVRQIDKSYIDYLIRLNISSYIDLLSVSILNRLSFLSSRPLPRETSAINMERARKDHYWPSANSVRKLEMVRRAYRGGGPQSSINPNWLLDASSSVHQDVSYVVGMGGAASPNAVCAQVITDFVSLVSGMLLGYANTPYKEVHLPLLMILHDIARLLYGSVDQDEWESRTSMLPPDLVKMRISNVTLACIPAPSIELIASFSEPDQTAVSTVGRQFLDKLTVLYTTTDTP